MPAAKTYAVAVKGHGTAPAPSNWLESLKQIEGVAIVGASERRAVIEATDEAIAQIREELSQDLHIERLVDRSPQGGG